MAEDRVAVDWSHSVALLASPAANHHSQAVPLQTDVAGIFPQLVKDWRPQTGLAGRKIEPMMTLNPPARKSGT